MSEIQLTPEQRRQMEKLAARVDRVTQGDRRFFERFPYRQHRVRLSSQAESQQNEIIAGPPVWLPDGYCWFTVVKNIAPGIRQRLFAGAPEGRETDLDEATAMAIYDAVSTPQSRQIEAGLRKMAEARSA